MVACSVSHLLGGARWLKRWGWFCRQIVPQVEAGWWGREGG